MVGTSSWIWAMSYAGSRDARQLPVGHRHDPAVLPDLLAVAVGPLAERDARGGRRGGAEPVEPLGEHRARLELDVGQPAAEPPDEVVGDVGRTVGHGEQLVEAWRPPVDLVDEGQLVEMLLGGGDAAVVVSRVGAGEEGQAPLAVDPGPDVGRPPVGRPRRDRPRTRAPSSPAPPSSRAAGRRRTPPRAAPGRRCPPRGHGGPRTRRREVAVPPVTSASTIQVSARHARAWRAARR